MTPRYWLTKRGDLITIEFSTNRVVARIEKGQGNNEYVARHDGATTCHTTREYAAAHILCKIGSMPQEMVTL